MIVQILFDHYGLILIIIRLLALFLQNCFQVCASLMERISSRDDYMGIAPVPVLWLFSLKTAFVEIIGRFIIMKSLKLILTFRHLFEPLEHLMVLPLALVVLLIHV